MREQRNRAGKEDAQRVESRGLSDAELIVGETLRLRLQRKNGRRELKEPSLLEISQLEFPEEGLEAWANRGRPA